MPAQRLNVSLEPRPLQLLYSKYAPERTPGTELTTSKTVTAARRSCPDAPPRYPRRQELGDLRKLGRELTKMERVQIYLSDKAGLRKSKTRSQPASTDANTRCVNHQCTRCSQEHVRDEGKTRMQDLKSKLRLVAARSLPDCSRERDTSPSRNPNTNQRVVQLPMLQLNMDLSKRKDIATLRKAQQSLKYMFHPTSVSRRAAGVWNYHFQSNSQPPDSRGYADSSDVSSSQLPPAVPNRRDYAAGSPPDNLYSDTASSFDADRVDFEQFDYVFDRFSISSTDSDTTLSGQESDARTFSARAQRPSTTDTVATQQRLVETRASGILPPASPISPRMTSDQRHRGGESWPPQYTVVPSWPALDDPFRFQYRGCGVHRDIMRRLHKSRGKRHQNRKGSDAEQQQKQPQKLKVVVPSHTNTECAECKLYGQNHHPSTPCPPNTPLPVSRYGTSMAGKSAKSRSSLSMSVCTLHSWRAQPPSQSAMSSTRELVDSMVNGTHHANSLDRATPKDRKV
nr:hypothetical protein BaRGS_027360 [Batillaria attramentaria]